MIWDWSSHKNYCFTYQFLQVTIRLQIGVRTEASREGRVCNVGRCGRNDGTDFKSARIESLFNWSLGRRASSSFSCGLSPSCKGCIILGAIIFRRTCRPRRISWVEGMVHGVNVTCRMWYRDSAEFRAKEVFGRCVFAELVFSSVFCELAQMMNWNLNWLEFWAIAE